MLSENIQLTQTTGYPHIDDMLRGVIGVYEVTFPNRILGYYLLGSYADKTATPDSDVDLAVIFKGICQAVERDSFHSLTAHLRQISPVLLDSAFYNEETLLHEAPARIMSTLVVYGSDRRADFVVESLDRHIARSIHAALQMMQTLRGLRDNLHAPLDYPDEEVHFYGYTRYGAHLGENHYGQGLRILVALTTMMATALIGIKAGQHAATKKTSVDLYAQHIGDEWADFISEVYRVMRLRWRCEIPEDPRDQHHLHNLCQWLLGFENHFLSVCGPVLLQNLHSNSEMVRHYSLESLKCVSYSEQRFIDALERLSHDDDHEDAARTVLARITD